MNTWRKEQTILGKLSSRPPTPRAEVSDGWAARMSMVHQEKLEAQALTAARGMEMQRMAAEMHGAQLQLEVLRGAHDEIGRTAAGLEERLRSECDKASKLKKQLERASARAKAAAEREAAARADAEAAHEQNEQISAILAAREVTIRDQTGRLQGLTEERDAAFVQAATRAAERDSAAGSLAEIKTEIAQLVDARQAVQVPSHCRPVLLCCRRAVRWQSAPLLLR